LARSPGVGREPVVGRKKSNAAVALAKFLIAIGPARRRLMSAAGVRYDDNINVLSSLAVACEGCDCNEFRIGYF
jgi:hypothetical protein